METTPSIFKDSILALDQTVANTVEFFHTASEELKDGEQTAREVISHIVYWHAEYVKILEAIVAGEPPPLLSRPLRFSNAHSYLEFQTISLPDLADRLGELQERMSRVLNSISDLDADFPVKTGLKYCSIAERVPQIAAHIRGHTERLERLQRKARSPQPG